MNKIIPSQYDLATFKNEKSNKDNAVGELKCVQDMDISSIVQEYLKLGDTKYCQRIQALHVFEELGYSSPKKTYAAQFVYAKKAAEFAEVLKNELNELGFKADKIHKKDWITNNGIKHAPKFTVYTNTPADPYFKAHRSLKWALSSLKCDHTKGVEVDVLESQFPNVFNTGEKAAELKKDIGFKMSPSSAPAFEAFGKFKKSYTPSKKEIYDFFNVRTTKAYEDKYIVQNK